MKKNQNNYMQIQLSELIISKSQLQPIELATCKLLNVKLNFFKTESKYKATSSEKRKKLQIHNMQEEKEENKARK